MSHAGRQTPSRSALCKGVPWGPAVPRTECYLQNLTFLSTHDAMQRGNPGTPLDRPADVLKSSSLPTMLTLRGSPALSSFRLQKLLQDLKTAGLPVRDVSAHF